MMGRREKASSKVVRDISKHMQAHVTKHMRVRHAPAAGYRLEEAPFEGGPVYEQLSPSLAASPWGPCRGDVVRNTLVIHGSELPDENTREIALFRDVKAEQKCGERKGSRAGM